MKRGFILALLVPVLTAGQPTSAILHRLAGPYRAPRAPYVDFQNSNRIEDLLHAGELRLSLSDAIALALENNLDIELQRYVPRIANTDVLRASGGGVLRGLELAVNQAPPGTGGPSGPLLTNLTSGSTPSPLVNTNFSDLALISEQQNNLSVTGTTPLATGPLPPAYDPALTGLFNWTHQTATELSTTLTGGSNWLVASNANGNLGYVQGFSPGTQVSVAFDNNRYGTNATRYTYNPAVSSSLGLTVTQPLLRGFGIGLNRRFIRIARNGRREADLVFRQQVIETVAGVARLYTDLVSLNEDVKVKREALRLAERLLEDNRNMVDQGTLAPIEVTRAQAQVAASRQALVTAEGLVRQQELIVKTVITRRGLADPAIRSARVAATDSVEEPGSVPLRPVQDLIQEALRSRPDLAQAGVQVENSNLSLRGSMNALLPQLDLVGVVQNGGLAGSANTLAGVPPPGAVFGGYNSTLGQIFRRDYPTYGVGLQLTLPLRNRVAQADAARDELQLRQSQVRRQQLEDQIRLEVEEAQVALESARVAYEAAVQTRILQEQSVDVERQKYSVGLSTNLLVIQFQSYLAQARSTEVAAKGAVAKARISLERATGGVLDRYGVSIEEAYQGKVR